MTRVQIPNIPHKYYELALVYILRGRDGKVKDRSIQKFATRKEFSKFRNATERLFERSANLEIHELHLRVAQEPEGSPYRASELWCPYCASWKRFVKHEGYTVCEICQISTADFYTKKYNPRFRNKGESIQKTPKGKTPVSDEEKREKARLRRERRKRERMEKK